MEFKGVANPEIYVLDFHEESITELYPLAGDRGNFVMSLFGSYGMLDKIRIGNPIMQGIDTVEEDIIKTNPKLIIGFGKQMVDQYIKSPRRVLDLSGNFFDIQIKGQDFKALVVMSPSYVLQRIDNSVSLQFAQDLYKGLQFIIGEYVDILKEKNILNAHSFDEFVSIYENNLSDEIEIAFDIETNARPPMMAGSRIIGFSISDDTTGVYVSIDSLDFHMDSDEENKIWDYLLNIIFEKIDKMIIHNTMYERPYLLHCKNYEIKFDKAHDTLVMARLLRDPKETAGLKYQAQKYLHYPDWETDLTTYVSCIRALIERIGLGPKKFQNLYSELNKGTITNVFDLNSKTLSTEFYKLDPVDQDEINGILESLYSVLIGLYDESEVNYLGTLISEKVIEAVNQGGIIDSTIPYNWIPDRLLSKYGAVDSLATVDLKKYFFNIMDTESTERVNLHKGYQNWLEHMYVAYVMERNGMYWNDDLACRDRDALSKQAFDCLKAVLLSPCFVPHIEVICSELYKPIILSDYMPEIAASQGYSVTYDHALNKYTVSYNNKRVAKDNINNILIPPNKRSLYISCLTDIFYEDVNKMTTYEELKEIYNPASTSYNFVPNMILLNDNLQMGGRITGLHTLSTSPSFEKVKGTLPAIDQKFLKIADYCCDVDLLKEEYGDDWASYRKIFFDGFCQFYNNYRKQITAPEIANIINNPEPVKIETFDDEGIITIFDNMVVQGIDPDNDKTWTEEFKWLVNFRIFKKAVKIISTYIDGSTGHKVVTIVDKKELQSGSHNLTRKRFYDEGHAKDDEDYLLMSSWAPNTAETGRWRSSFHTLPWTSPVKKYYESRFVGGTTCCPDYSAMEVRTLSAISRDENMLQLFKNGEDFHRNTASSIFRKPKEEITPTERRFSKTGTFSILYGSSVESFAKKYCNGDTSYAQQIYDGFYNAYPGAKKWMDERHEEVLKEHRVSLELSNRFIPVVPNGDDISAVNQALRRSVNYPIQGQSADITGCVIFDLQKYIEENNMKSLIFMYVHDSIEVDIYPYEMFEFIEYLKYLLNEAPMRRMGLPSEADVALGKSLGDEIGLEELEVSPDKTSGTMILKGYKDEIDETVENWKKAYKTVEVSEENYEDVFISMNELFMLKKAYSTVIGTHRQKGTCKVHIDYYN